MEQPWVLELRGLRRCLSLSLGGVRQILDD